MENLEQTLTAIQERNRRVELDKAWEISRTRRSAIAALTYLVAVGWLLIIRESNPALKAFVPVAGYLLSTFSLPFIKAEWLKRHT